METVVEKQPKREEEGNIHWSNHYYKSGPWFGEMEGIRDEYVTIIRLRFGHNCTP